VNRIFEHAGVPYRPHLDPSSKACEEAVKKRKQEVGAGPSAKHAKVSGQKTVVAKATHSKSALKAKVLPRAGILMKAMVTSVSSVSKVVATVTPRGRSAQNQHRGEKADCRSISNGEREASEARC
jgi:hypothetical protein